MQRKVADRSNRTGVDHLGIRSDFAADPGHGGGNHLLLSHCEQFSEFRLVIRGNIDRLHDVIPFDAFHLLNVSEVGAPSRRIP
jgi:hypothetical protein